VPERLTEADIIKMARLARLELTPHELDEYTHQMASMIEHFDDIDSLNLADVEPMTQPYPLVNVLRDDVEADTLDRDEVLASAPAAQDGRFRVPPVAGIEP
jgi:aspartyl-tRNA(Asn)/glutamyl-tRNA(Gln) amidotransferase subunit C